MEKFASPAPCPYHGLTKPGAKYTNVIYNSKGGGHVQQDQHQQYRVDGGRDSEAPETMEPIWDIVSALAQALNTAKDQLQSLMQFRSTSPQKAARRPNYIASSNGNGCVNIHGGLPLLRSGTPRCCSPPHLGLKGGARHFEEEDADTRNIHRSHARGYCAFGRNTEFKEKMHNSRNGGRIHSSPGQQRRDSSGGGGGGSGDGSGNYGIRLQGGTGTCGIKVIPNGKSYTCIRDRGKQGLHLQAKMKNCNMNLDTDTEKFGPKNPMKIQFSAPSKVRYPSPYRQFPPAEVKRYCVGTQYANLLREEAHHLREKRIREERKIMKKYSS